MCVRAWSMPLGGILSIVSVTHAETLYMFPQGENMSLVYVPIDVVVIYGDTVVPRGGRYVRSTFHVLSSYTGIR